MLLLTFSLWAINKLPNTPSIAIVEEKYICNNRAYPNEMYVIFHHHDACCLLLNDKVCEACGRENY